MTPHSCVRYFLIEHYTSYFTSFVNKMLWSIKTKSSNRTSDHKLLLFRYFSEAENNTGFMGHFCGALAGLLVGIFVLDNRRIQTWETFIDVTFSWSHWSWADGSLVLLPSTNCLNLKLFCSTEQKIKSQIWNRFCDHSYKGSTIVN